MRLACAALLVFVCGCDPGFAYVLRGAPQVKDDGVRYVVDVGHGVLARFYSSVFIRNGHVEIEVLNQSDVPLSFVPTPTLISNGAGETLDARGCMFSREISPTSSIEARKEDVIEKGQRARILCGFGVDFGGGLFHSYPPRTMRVSFTQLGFSQSGRPLDIRAKMEAD